MSRRDADDGTRGPAAQAWLGRLVLSLLFVFGLLATSAGVMRSAGEGEREGDPIAEESEDGEVLGQGTLHARIARRPGTGGGPKLTSTCARTTSLPLPRAVVMPPAQRRWQPPRRLPPEDDEDDDALI